MIDEKLQLSSKEDEFYSKPIYLSYSALNLILFSPKLYYNKYILGNKEEFSSQTMIDGKVIHCLLLDNGSFDNEYIMTPKSLPTGNTRIIIDKVYDIYKNELDTDPNRLLSDFHPEIITVLKEIKLHQSLKTDTQRVEKIITEESKSYWDFLKIRGNKTLLDDETLYRCKDAVDAVKQDKMSCELLGIGVSELENVEVLNEHYLDVDTEYSFGLKGIVDNIKLDKDTQTLHINDLKTTGKTLSDFKDTIEFYNYWAQAAIYVRLVTNKYFAILNDEWRIQFNFIVIDKYNQVYPFQVSPATMHIWQMRLEQKLKEVEWHYINRKFNLPYQFASGQIIL